MTRFVLAAFCVMIFFAVCWSTAQIVSECGLSSIVYGKNLFLAWMLGACDGE